MAASANTLEYTPQAQMIGQNPQAKQIMASLQAHIAEHLGFSYRKKIEEKLQKELSVTVRCYSFKEQINGKCIFTGKPGKLAIFGKSY